MPGPGPQRTELIDVCNGDADGLCSLLQLRLYEPAETLLITGLKRELDLLERVHAVKGDRVTVLDLALERNLAALGKLLERGVHVRYFDHHECAHIPVHAGLEALIDTSPQVCTGILIDRLMGGRYPAWAAVCAYGDNLPQAAERLARAAQLDDRACHQLRVIGEAVNYNAYGESELDVLLPPAQLYAQLRPYDDPLAAARNLPVLRELSQRREADLLTAQRMLPHMSSASANAFLLPDAPWARRVIGTFANVLAASDPLRAHAVLRLRADGRYLASVRAPLAQPWGAGELCALFGGGGRAGAAGLDALTPQRLPVFLDRFLKHDWRARPGSPSLDSPLNLTPSAAGQTDP